MARVDNDDSRTPFRAIADPDSDPAFDQLPQQDGRRVRLNAAALGVIPLPKRLCTKRAMPHVGRDGFHAGRGAGGTAPSHTHGALSIV